MGLLGAMNGVMVRYLDIGNLGIGVTLAAMVGLILGGTARVWGAVVGVDPDRGRLRHRGPVLPAVPHATGTPRRSRCCARQRSALALILVLLFRPLGLLGDMRRDKLMGKIHGR